MHRRRHPCGPSTSPMPDTTNFHPRSLCHQPLPRQASATTNRPPKWLPCSLQLVPLPRVPPTIHQPHFTCSDSKAGSFCCVHSPMHTSHIMHNVCSVILAPTVERPLSHCTRVFRPTPSPSNSRLPLCTNAREGLGGAVCSFGTLLSTYILTSPALHVGLSRCTSLSANPISPHSASDQPPPPWSFHPHIALLLSGQPAVPAVHSQSLSCCVVVFDASALYHISFLSFFLPYST